MDQKTRDVKSETDRKEAFAKWLDMPINRMAMSMIPAGEHQDTLRLILEGAFEAGANYGAAAVAMMMFEGIIKRSDKRP